MALEIGRRTFLAGAGAAICGAGAAGTGTLALADAASQADTPAPANQASALGVPADYAPVGTYTCDVCVVGAGNSGLAAAVQAAQSGAGVVVLEAISASGGGGRGTEGVFGVGSQMQQDAGIEIEPVEILKTELDYAHGRTDGAKWLDMVHASGDNIDWLSNDCGVPFSGVDNYMGTAPVATFHWFDGGRSYGSYAPSMTSCAEGLGVRFVYNTRALKLLLDDDGAVRGVVARRKSPDGGEGDYIEVDCGAVILCTGGFANNDEYLSVGRQCDVSDVHRPFVGFNGDGLAMAKEAGAADNLARFAAMELTTISGFPGGFGATYDLGGNGLISTVRAANTIWVQQDGVRFGAENSGDGNGLAVQIPLLNQQHTYAVFNRAILEADIEGLIRHVNSVEDDLAFADAWFEENPHGDALRADTVEELCAKAHEAFPQIDADTLADTIARYNEMCAAGEDADFGKPAEYLVALDEGPFYLVKHIPSVAVTFGGIRTNRKMEVIREDWTPVAGLYSAGVDSADLWPNIYTVNVPGGCNGNNINSGRAAALSATAYLGELGGAVTEEGDTADVKVAWDGGEMPAALKDGIWTSEPAFGMFGTITATVTVQDGKIASIAQENECETDYLGVVAMEQEAQLIIDAQDVHVDTVGGATMSCNGLRAAVLDACQQAAE